MQFGAHQYLLTNHLKNIAQANSYTVASITTGHGFLRVNKNCDYQGSKYHKFKIRNQSSITKTVSQLLTIFSYFFCARTSTFVSMFRSPSDFHIANILIPNCEQEDTIHSPLGWSIKYYSNRCKTQGFYILFFNVSKLIIMTFDCFFSSCNVLGISHACQYAHPAKNAF